MSPSDEVRPATPVRTSFIAAYTLAQIGAFVSFMPLFQVLLPLKAEAIDPANKALLLSQVAFYGAMVASVANLLAGAISDRTTSRFGRRRPWMVVGSLGAAGAYLLIMGQDAAGPDRRHCSFPADVQPDVLGSGRGPA